jgi:enoyl-CoA hydratase/carnithine racemase
LALTGRIVTAEEGRQLGFVNEVTSSMNNFDNFDFATLLDDKLLSRAREIAREIIKLSPRSVIVSKELCLMGVQYGMASLASAFYFACLINL